MAITCSLYGRQVNHGLPALSHCCKMMEFSRKMYGLSVAIHRLFSWHMLPYRARQMPCLAFIGLQGRIELWRVAQAPILRRGFTYDGGGWPRSPCPYRVTLKVPPVPRLWGPGTVAELPGPQFGIAVSSYYKAIITMPKAASARCRAAWRE